MKVIFLDIDGVLNVIGQGHDEFGQTFHKHFEDNLRHLIDSTGAKIVMSSSWRSMGLERVKLMWQMRDLPGEVIDITPYFRDELVNRGEEIAYWLRGNEVDSYVILDDDDDMLDEQFLSFVRTANNTDHEDCIDIGYGLTKKCTEKAIQILNS